MAKTILDKYHITDTIELILEKDHIILKPKTNSRSGWEKSIRKMHDNRDDRLLMPDIFEDGNLEEWT